MRDPSYEAYGFYRKRVAQIVDASLGVFISSDGFRRYLPNSAKIHTTHNIRKADLGQCGVRSDLDRNHLPIRISFWGCVRDREINEKLLGALANDDRFVIQYFGTMNGDSKRIIDFCKERDIANVVFSGRYQPDDRYRFAKNTELIHNIYSNSYTGHNPCVGNKYYDGIVFQIPQICLTGGYMGELVSKQGVGMSVNITDTLGDALWEYYQSINWDEFNACCEMVLSHVVDEYATTASGLRKIIAMCRNGKSQ